MGPMGDRVSYIYIHQLCMMSFEHIGYVFGSCLSIVTSIKISRNKQYKIPRLISFETLIIWLEVYEKKKSKERKGKSGY